MGTVKIVIGNSFTPIIEEYICNKVDIFNQEEVAYAAEECIGDYLEKCEDIFHALGDVDFDTFAEKCWYIIEEVIIND
jgi:hypothetical protein